MIFTVCDKDIIPVLSKLKYPYYKSPSCWTCGPDESFQDHEAFYIVLTPTCHAKRPYTFLHIGDIVGIAIRYGKELVGFYIHPEVRKLGIGKVLLTHVCEQSPISHVMINYDMYPYLESSHIIRLLCRMGFIITTHSQRVCILYRT